MGFRDLDTGTSLSLIAELGISFVFVAFLVVVVIVLVVVVLVVVVVMVWIFLPETNSAQDRAHAHPFRIVGNYGTLLRDRRFMAPATLMAFVLGGVYTLPALMPFVLIGKLGLTPLQYALVVRV